MKIIPKLIPPAEVNLLAATVLQSAKAFYADPQNEARYQAWKAERERKGVNHYKELNVDSVEPVDELIFDL